MKGAPGISISRRLPLGKKTRFSILVGLEKQDDLIQVTRDSEKDLSQQIRLNVEFPGQEFP